MDDLNELAERLESALPSEERVILAAASNPLAFLAIHGCSASDYIMVLRKARRTIAAMKTKASEDS